MWVLPYMKHMWSEFSALGLYQAEQRKRVIKKNAKIYGQSADVLVSANNIKKTRVNDETKNNEQWLERRKKRQIADGGEARKK